MTTRGEGASVPWPAGSRHGEWSRSGMADWVMGDAEPEKEALADERETRRSRLSPSGSSGALPCSLSMDGPAGAAESGKERLLPARWAGRLHLGGTHNLHTTRADTRRSLGVACCPWFDPSAGLTGVRLAPVAIRLFCRPRPRPDALVFPLVCSPLLSCSLACFPSILSRQSLACHIAHSDRMLVTLAMAS